MIDDDDIEWHSLRTMPGGQHVGTDNRLIGVHRPTGIAVFIETERSQFKAHAAARHRLHELLLLAQQAGLYPPKEVP